MKMAYERPVMRVEEFRTNAYCGDCNWKLIGSTTIEYLKATITGKDKNTYTFYFDPNQVNSRNDGTGDSQHYFNEYVFAPGMEPADSNNNGDPLTAWDRHDNNLGTTNATNKYFLEWSAPNEAFYIYQDMSNSGYSSSQNGPFTDENHVLQVNGNNYGWNSSNQNKVADLYDTNGRDGWYRSDRNIWEGHTADSVLTEEGKFTEFGWSY